MASWGGRRDSVQDYSSGEPALDVPGTAVPSVNLSPYALDPSYLPQGPEFIFPVESQQKSWNEKMFNRMGTGYVSGLALGGVWGLYEGLRHPEGRTVRLRMTSILNGCTRRGPFLGNHIAVLALMYSPLESLIGHYRGEDDSLNSITAAGISGVLFKSTAGPRAMLVGGVVGCSLFAALAIGKYMMGRHSPNLIGRNYT